MAENLNEGEGMQVDEDDFILSLSPGEGTGNGVSEVIATEVTDLPADLVNTDVSELVETDNSSLWLTLEGSLSGTQDLEAVSTVAALSSVTQSDITNSVIQHEAFAEDALIQSEDTNPVEVETMEVEMPHDGTIAEGKEMQSTTLLEEGPFIEVSQSTDNVEISAGPESFETQTVEVQPAINFASSEVSKVVITQASQLQISQNQVFYSLQSSGVGGGAPSSLRLVNTVSSGAKPIASVVSAAGIAGQQPIRLLSPAKTITLQQAQQLGLFSPRKAPTIAISKVAISSSGTFATTTAGISTLAAAAAAKQPGKLALPAGNVTVVKNPVLRTPTKIAPAPPQPATSGQQPTSLFIKNSAGQVTMATLVSKAGSPTVASSPQKIVLRPATPSSVTSSPAKVSGQPAQYIRLTTAQAVAAGILPGASGTPTGTGQLQIGNSKIQLVRLVTPGASSGSTSATTPLSPVVVTTSTSSIKVVPKTTGGATSRVTTPVKSAASPASSTTHGAQRLLLPAGSLNSLAGSNLVVVPAQYVSQQQVSVAPSNSSGAQQLISSVDSVAAAAADIKPQQNSAKSTQSKITMERSPSDSSTSQNQGSKTPAALDANGIKPRKPCNCTKSQCLKLYCDCFANGEFCNGCNCVSCANNLEHEELRSRAVRACLDRNPLAFKPKIGVSWGPEPRRHNKGCHCKRSSCLKNYCECYEAKIACTAICKCVGCKNCFDGEPLAVTPEKKVTKSGPPAFQYAAPEPVVPITIKTEERAPVDVPSRGPPVLSLTGTRPAFSFITQEVVEATCQCLLAQAEEAEKAGKDTVAAEGMVLEEFGRCLLQIIEYAAKAKIAVSP